MSNRVKINEVLDIVGVKKYLLGYEEIVKIPAGCVECVPVKNYFVPGEYIPVLLKIINVSREHRCIMLMNPDYTRGKFMTNGWGSRLELRGELVYNIYEESVHAILSTKTMEDNVKIKLML